MTKLKNLRTEIDRIDEKIIPLLEERFALIDQIASEKTSLTDKDREEEILGKITSPYIQKIYKEIFRISKSRMIKASDHFPEKTLSCDE